MNKTNSQGLVPRRRDELSDWHDLVAQDCENCGCELFVAKDDPLILWEPGRAWTLECTNQQCSCHTDPVIGKRRGE
ncbi:MAG: hypothetical protein ACRDJ2_05235 [Actinomycetota bacterium]